MAEEAEEFDTDQKLPFGINGSSSEDNLFTDSSDEDLIEDNSANEVLKQKATLRQILLQFWEVVRPEIPKKSFNATDFVETYVKETDLVLYSPKRQPRRHTQVHAKETSTLIYSCSYSSSYSLPP